MVDDKAARERANHRRDAEDAAEETLIASAFARRHDVADDGDRRHDQAAAAETLHDAERDEFRQVLGHAAQRRAEEEDHNCRLQHDAPPEQISELAVEGNDDRRCQEIGRHDPGEVGQAADLADDGRQRGRDDRLIEGGEQEDEHERGEDRHTLPRACVAVVTAAGNRSLHGIGRAFWLRSRGRRGRPTSRWREQ